MEQPFVVYPTTGTVVNPLVNTDHQLAVRNPFDGMFQPDVKHQEMVSKYKRFLPIALAVAAMSKDKSSKFGALILGPGFEIRSSGWNGAPRGCKADDDARFDVRSEKYMWVAHAEANAIVNAARTGTALEGCTLLVNGPPCMGCAKLIVQAGIKRVLVTKPKPDFYERWKEDIDRARALFSECGVECIEFDTKE